MAPRGVTDTASHLRHALLTAAERFTPPGTDVETATRVRSAVLIGWAGGACAAATGLATLLLGVDRWTGASIVAIGVCCLCAPPLLRRGVSLSLIAHGLTGALYVASYVVAARTGGLASPALTWSFLHPLNLYVAAGRGAAALWTALGAVQLAVFFAVTRIGLTFPVAVDPATEAVFRVGAYAVMIVAALIVVLVVDGVRRDLQQRSVVAERIIERQRILADMHDGVGGHLLSVLTQARLPGADPRLVARGVEDALDDLRLVVHALDASAPDLQTALAEVCWRMEQRAEAAAVLLQWPKEVDVNLGAERNLQVLRAVQEMITNALRHAKPTHIVLTVTKTAGGQLEVVVHDDGSGIAAPSARRTGRGLSNLHQRATALRGAFSVARAERGTRAALVIPMDPT